MRSQANSYLFAAQGSIDCCSTVSSLSQYLHLSEGGINLMNLWCMREGERAPVQHSSVGWALITRVVGFEQFL